jgi:hypothetical protein
MMFERLKFEIAWHWNHQRHNVVVCGIMIGAILAGSLIIGGNIVQNIAEAGRHRN